MNVAVAALTALLLVASTVRAAGPTVTLESAHGACSVHGGFAVAAPAAIAWDVLADYDGIAKFVRSIESSHIERRDDGRTLLRQEAIGGTWFVRRRMEVLLELEESHGERIRFHDVLGRDFRRYAGEWRVTAGPRGTQVDYDLTAEPRAALARMFCRGALQGTATELLTQVRAEILRRSAGQGVKP